MTFLRRLSLLFLIVFSSLSSLSQVAYHDALTLAAFVDPATNHFYDDMDSLSVVAGILNQYLSNQNQISDVRTILLAYKYENDDNINHNPIIGPYIPQLNTAAASANAAPILGGLGNFVGGLNVTTIADGLSKFIVERAKEELNIAFFNQFREEIEREEGLHLLFPQTTRVFSVIDKEIYNYSYYIQTLREAFQKDLSLLLSHLAIYIQKEKFDPLFKNQALREVAVETLPVIQSALNGSSPFLLIDQLSEIDFEQDELFNLENGFGTLALLSKSLLATTGSNRQWIDLKQANVLLKNEVAFSFYLGLLYQQAQNIEFKSKDENIISFREVLIKVNNAADEKRSLTILIESLLSSAERVDDYKAQYETQAERLLAPADYYNYFNAAIALISQAAAIPSLLLGEPQNANTASKAVAVLDLLAAIGLDVKVKNYNSAVFNIVLLLEEISSNDISALKSALLKYGTFAANVASAESSEEVKLAIEAVALPAGSATIKRNTKSNISINSYLGLFGGSEWLKDKAAQENKFVFGLTAPIGVAFSWGMIHKNENKGAFTAFMRLIDLGAIASFRFNDPNTAVLPELKFQNILAPGLDIIYGFPKSPLSLGVGSQLGPALREISADELTLNSSINWRFHAFIAVDIPLLNLYTKTR